MDTKTGLSPWAVALLLDTVTKNFAGLQLSLIFARKLTTTVEEDKSKQECFEEACRREKKVSGCLKCARARCNANLVLFAI